MPDLLFELFSEEIPARMQMRAAEDLRKMVTDKLVAEGLIYEGAKAFVTPRRLTLTVQGIPVRQPDLKEEKKGPKVGAPEGAIAGFLRSAGLKSIDEATIQKDPKKGDFYVALIEKPGRPAIDVLAEILPVIVRTFPWPKQMRWGERSARPGALTWVRPLHSIVATFGPETEDPEIVPFSVDGIAAGNTTRGHRFLAPAAITVKRFDDYAAKLEKAKVVLDHERRREIVRADAKNLAFASGFEVIEDDGLLAEVAGLVEWPVVLMGSFDEAFLKIPGEVIRATIRNNQKCFVVRKPGASPFETRPAAAPQGEAGRGSHPEASSDPQGQAGTGPHPEEARSAVSQDGSGQLANKFILVANTEASDGGKAIVAGNERVIRARLSDAKFFYETDLKTKLEDRLPKFDQIIFHEKLGTQAERIARIERLAAEIAPLVNADVAKVARAAKLCKADLLTEVVGEFPETQGLMGKYYALAQGEDAAVAAACEEHYKPVGAGDRVPTDPVSIAVALADKIDTLVGFWAIDEKPTGSKDPYALRRAALGVIRLILDNHLRISLTPLVHTAIRLAALKEVDLISKIASFDGVPSQQREFMEHHRIPFMRGFSGETGVTSGTSGHPSFFKFVWFYPEFFLEIASKFPIFIQEYNPPEKDRDLLSFFADRLKVQLREQGARHDLVDAVFSLGNQDDLVMVVRRVEALGKFLATDDGKSLLAGTKRAANILRIEEKKDGVSYDSAPDAGLYQQDEEKTLAAAIAVAKDEAGKAVAKEDFAAAMTAMAKLRPHVDAFFDKVTVNADDKAVRANRLKLLSEIRAATRTVADFSKIEG